MFLLLFSLELVQGVLTAVKFTWQLEQGIFFFAKYNYFFI